MVNNMVSDYLFAAASEAELNDLVAGGLAGNPSPWPGRRTVTKLTAGSVGVVWKQPRTPLDPIHPLVLVVRNEDQKRLFGRFAQLRGDLSPLSAWCHIIEPNRFEILDSLTRETDLGGLEAAWAGLVIAESVLLAERSIPKIRIAACLATQSYAIARAKALWEPISISEIMGQYDAAQGLFRAGQSRTVRLRTTLEPIWNCLGEVTTRSVVLSHHEFRPIIECLRALQDARAENDPNEARRFAKPLKGIVGAAEIFERLPDLTPEQRVREFDNIVNAIDGVPHDEVLAHRHSLALLAGYLATVAAGGAPSLSLAEAFSNRWPEITAWAYVVGGVGERVVWTSSFDGLGRLVARELMRPLRLDEPPTCDFALDEARVLFDPQLTDPLVHLRIKQSRIVTSCLVPGVNISILMEGQLFQEARSSERVNERVNFPVGNRRRSIKDPMSLVAEVIWPYLIPYLDEHIASSSATGGSLSSRKPKRQQTNKRNTSQRKLPLKTPGQR